MFDWCRFCCALSRIGCYKCCHKAALSRPEFTVVALGLSNAGKSTLLSILANEELQDDCVPTQGFSIKVLQFPDAILNVMELGGAVEQYWCHYYCGAEGIVFVIDSSDNRHLEQAAECLSRLLNHPILSGLPLLILANKQDVANAKDANEIKDILSLDKIADDNDYIIYCCSSQDVNSIREGFVDLIHKLKRESPNTLTMPYIEN
ncbi:ADP-ribosylation factor-like protein 15 [Xenia sp. Carnegie-2017]|uniref:ADP-ribosylation factor-like protein 15 n=1 Tax=Xenia sp. Carnegie-2017 TaxID=2897299 RepID=UPI001F0494C2|nr:ADP-ribosylation factor-like protein 15 [Xenia sp. Carnegie-2017]